MSSDVLKGEYKDTYTNIVMYLSISNIPNDFLNEVSEDVKDLLVNAQNDEMDVKNIIGNNIEDFCKEIIKTKKFKNQSVFNVVKSINLALFMSAITSLGYYLINIPMTLNVIFMFIIDYLFFTFIFGRGLRKAVLKGKDNVKKIAIILLLFVLFLIAGSILNYILLTMYVINIDSLYTAMVLLITMVGIHIVAKVLRDRKIKILN
ncbi:DUF1048 domain-containing protein [Clostridium sp. UBA1056]|uniref:DUF1048 domain-containing protein n=1 Tax=unclassified Clostridium TaxID=2614128 RepID=UPI003216C9A8